jgi:hypothetical protein
VTADGIFAEHIVSDDLQMLQIYQTTQLVQAILQVRANALHRHKAKPH